MGYGTNCQWYWYCAVGCEMKAIIAGSRDFHDYDFMEAKLVGMFLSTDYPTQIISGTARGADRLGEQFAKSFDIELVLVEANWKTEGKKAGVLRNIRMAEKADILLAFWDGKSKGTRHMINTALEKNLEVHVWVV